MKMALKDDITTPNVPDISLPDTQLKTTSVKNPIEIIPRHADVNPFATENRGFYSTMYGQFFGDQRPETPEEKAKREKRERSRSAIFALSDGLSNIANIWGATQGATPMNLASLSEANRRRYEYADNLRRKNEDAWKHGLLQARIGDMNLRRQEEAMKAKATKDERDFRYKVGKDNQDYQLNVNKYLSGLEQQERENARKREAFEETKRANKVRENIGWTNANTAKERANKEGKTAYFSAGHGNVIEVPDAKKYAFAAQVYRKMVEASGGSESPVLKFYETEIEGSVPNNSAMLNAINYHIEDFPEVQEYMYKLAGQYRTGVGDDPASVYKPGATLKDSPKAGALVGGAIAPKTTSTPGSPTNANVPISQGVFEDWNDYEIE